MMVPFEVARALRADGWYLRQDIIWHKTNPTPESIKDRCTSAHEHIFLLAKSEQYFFDSDAIAEPSIWVNDKRFGKGRVHVDGRKLGAKEFVQINETKNKRDVWSVARSMSDEDHTAIYPEELIEPCILAGCPPGGTVLDPFAGSGTTGVVAERLGRGAVLVELNPQYVEAIKARLVREMPPDANGADADGYDANADFAASINVAYEAIRDRVAAGGPGYTPQPPGSRRLTAGSSEPALF
jgi:DNA modification methylase